MDEVVSFPFSPQPDSLSCVIKPSSGWKRMIFVNESAMRLLCSLNVCIVIDLWVRLLKGCETVSVTPFVTQQFHSLIKLKVLLILCRFLIFSFWQWIFYVARQKNN